jgi:hypothetical protein
MPSKRKYDITGQSYRHSAFSRRVAVAAATSRPWTPACHSGQRWRAITDCPKGRVLSSPRPGSCSPYTESGDAR